MRKAETFFRHLAVLETVLLVSLTACNSGSGPSATGPFHTRKPAFHRPAPAVPGQEPLSEMVSAVSASNVGPAVQLKFDLMQRPEVGQPVDLAVALVPGSPGPDSISAQFQATDGLEIVNGAELPQVDKPAEGAALRHTVKILPKRDGIFAVTALVSVGSASETATRTFSIPVIAGAGLSEAMPNLPAAKPPTAKPPGPRPAPHPEDLPPPRSPGATTRLDTETTAPQALRPPVAKR